PKGSAAAGCQSRLFGAVKVPSRAPVATRARRNASDGILGTVAMRGSIAARLSSRRLAPENVAPASASPLLAAMRAPFTVAPAPATDRNNSSLTGAYSAATTGRPAHTKAAAITHSGEPAR